MDLIIAEYKEILTIIISLLIYVFVVSNVYPRIFLRAELDKKEIKDRGIKKYVFKGGRAILYEPSLNCRKYINQYLLSVNEGKKYIKCRIDERIKSLKYEVAVFDSSDKFVKIVEVCEPVRSEGQASAVPLPPETAFVSVNVREVNGVSVDTGKALSLQLYKIMYFALLTVMSSVLLTFFLWKKLEKYYMMWSWQPDEPPQVKIAFLVALMVGMLVSWFIINLNLSESVKVKYN